MCNVLSMSFADARILISKKGEQEVNGFIICVEREVAMGGQKLKLVSLWKDGKCYFKSPVNPDYELFQSSMQVQ